MADFSEYGPFTKQFEELWAKQPAPPNLSVQEFKTTTNNGREKVSQEEMKALGPQITMQDHKIPTRDGSTLEARAYRSKPSHSNDKLPLYIHLHGGGFLFGTLSSEDANCARIAIATPVVVLNVNYRHTPEHVYPTAWNDSEDAFDWALTNADTLNIDKTQVIIGGVSAGSWLTASLVQNKRSPSIIGQILMIPAVVHNENYDSVLSRLKSRDVSSYVQNEHAPILPKARMDFFNSLLFPEPPRDRRANPGNADADEVKGLPPAVFGVAGADPLRDEGLLYAQLLAENGVPTNVHVFKGLPHGFRRFGAQLEQASAAWDETITGGIKWILGKPKASSKDIDIQVH